MGHAGARSRSCACLTVLQQHSVFSWLVARMPKSFWVEYTFKPAMQLGKGGQQ